MPEPSREILFHGGIIRPDPHHTAEALLIRDGMVAAVGSAAEVEGAATPAARRVHLDGATVTAGFVDAHIHLTAWSLTRRRIDLSDCHSLGAVAERVRAAAGGGEGWILGQGWHLERLGEEPRREVLDRAAPGRPVFLDSHDIHAAWLSSAALERLMIDPSTPDPDGGALVRDAGSGALTGVLLEQARIQALERLPIVPPEEIDAAVRDGQAELHRLGITGVHSVEPDGLSQVQRMRDRHELTLRVLQHLPVERLEEARRLGVRSGLGDDRVRVGGMKMFLDGALGSRTAWLHEPYEGTPDDHGICTFPPDEFRETVRRAAASGIATTVHAIGDAAVEVAVEVLSETPSPVRLPHRIEHVQLCPPRLWSALGDAGIVASVQPVHLRTDIPALDRHWGRERSRGAYAFAPLARGGAILALGSDAPVETPDPREGLMAAVHRVAREGRAPYYPEHALTPEQALAGYTTGPAEAERRAHRRGVLRPGFDADLTVWTSDPVTTPPGEMLSIRCIMTVVGGEVVYEEGG